MHFIKYLKINELICGAPGTGYISPLAGTKSILMKCEKMTLDYFSYHLVLSDSAQVMVNTYTMGPKFMWEIIFSYKPVAMFSI